MNKRLPLLLSLLAVILLAVSLAYWILQLYQPPQRPLAAAPVATMPDPTVESAAMLFGGQPAAAVATNYQLTGVISAGSNSVAIIVADGAPAKALRVGRELAPGVTVAEVYPRYVMLSDSGVMKRIDLAVDAKAAAPMGGVPQGMPPGMVQGAPQGMPPGMQGMPPGAVMTPITPAGTPPPAPPAEQTPLAPGAVVQQQQPQQQQRRQQQQPQQQEQQSEPPPANPNSAPANPNSAPGQQPNNAPQDPNTNTQ